MVETRINMKKLSLLLAVLVFISVQSAFSLGITSISPSEGQETINQQPLLSWTNSELINLEEYTLIVSQNEDLTEAKIHRNVSTTFYQIQQSLALGKWYWKVQATGQNENNLSIIDESELFSFTVIELPQYTIIPDLSRYDEEKRVTFVMDAPLGSAVDIMISKSGFSLPFTSTSLLSQTFVSFLDPGTYTINAEFTNNGFTSTYERTFTVEQYTIPTHEVNFNITDQDKKALLGVKIHILGSDHNYNKTITTNSEGLTSITLEEARYNINIYKEGYYDKDITRKKIDEKINFTYSLFEEDYFDTLSTTDNTPSVQSTSLTILPEVSLIQPNYRDEVKEEITAVFAVNNHAYAKQCELLFRMKDQKGWSILATLEEIESAGNSLIGKIDDDLYGEAQIKVRCHAKHSDTTKDSAIRTIIVLMPPQHHEGLQEFLAELDEAKNTLTKSKDPLYEGLALTESISQTRNNLLKLDEQYFTITGEGKTGEAEALSKTIEERIEELREELIVGFTIIKTEDISHSTNPESLRTLIESYLEQEEEKGELFMIEEKEKEDIIKEVLEQQSNYFIRTKSTVAELTYADESKKYITGLTRTIQSLTEEENKVHVVEELNSYLLQHSGETTLLAEEEKQTITANQPRYFLTLDEGESYSISFEGDVSELLKMESALALIPEIDYTSYKEGKKGLEAITGRAVDALSGEGGFLSIMFWALIGIVLIGFVFSPLIINKSSGKKRKTIHSSTQELATTQFQTSITDKETTLAFPSLFSGKNQKHKKEKKQNKMPLIGKGKIEKKIRIITDSVHDVLDLIELGNHQEAFTHFPKIISLYEELPLVAQEELSFAVQLLTAELDAYDLQTHVAQAHKHLDALTPEHDLSVVTEHTNHMIRSYATLDEHARKRVKPSLQAYQEKLEEKHRQFSRKD